MAVTGLQKWPCPSCTYINWSSSVKCVLCGCSRPNELTSKASVAKYRPPVQGWSKLAHTQLQGSGGACLSPEIICADFNHQSPSITADSQPQNHHHHHHHKGSGHGVKCKTKGKWTCGSCTFSNWPNAGQCTMCGTSRSRGGQRNDPIISGGRRESSSRSPLLSESILNYASSVGGAVGGAAYNAGSAEEKAPSSLSQDLFIQPSSAKSKHNSRNSKRTSSQHQAENCNIKKWKCHQCTYENWPRAVKCVMCQSLRRRTPSPPFSGGEERDTPGRVQFSTASSTSQQATSRLSPPSHLPSSCGNSPSPIHSRSSSNSNETLVTSQQRGSSTEGSNTAATSQKEGGSGGRLIATYECDSWSSLEIEPSTELKSDSDEVMWMEFEREIGEGE